MIKPPIRPADNLSPKGSPPLAAGLYVLEGDTGTGKSTVAVALYRRMTALNPVLLRVNESGAGLMQLNDFVDAFIGTSAVLGMEKKGPTAYGAAEYASPGGPPLLFIVDSITLFMVSAGTQRWEIGGPTQEGFGAGGAFSGGLLPAHALFLFALNHALEKAGVAMVAILNTKTFPLKGFEGIVQGAVSVPAYGQLSFRDRIDRKQRSLVFSDAELEAARKELGYPSELTSQPGTAPSSGAANRPQATLRRFL